MESGKSEHLSGWVSDLRWLVDPYSIGVRTCQIPTAKWTQIQISGAV